MKFFLKLFILSFVIFYSGCSLSTGGNSIKNSEKFSCNEKAKPKSLQLLEQQYRCQREE